MEEALPKEARVTMCGDFSETSTTIYSIEMPGPQLVALFEVV